MVSARPVLLGGALLLVLVLQCEAQETFTFDLEEKVQKYVENWSAREKQPVSWWDMEGKHKHLIEHAYKYKKFKVTVTAGTLKYLEVRSTTAQPNVMHTQWIHNDSPIPTKTTIRRKKVHTRSNSWHTDWAFHAGVNVTATAKIPFVDIHSQITTSVNLKTGASESVAETEEFSIKKEVTVAPFSSVKVEWIITDFVQEIPWNAEVTARGWFAVWFDKKVNNHWLWFPPICRVTDPLLKSDCNDNPNQGGSVKFTAKGTFVGVKNTETHLRVSKHDLNAYSRKPISVEIIKLPRH